MSFSKLGLAPELLNELVKQGFISPYPIQQKAIPVILQHTDVLGIAKTGSGKTASYVLPILTNLLGGKDPKNRHIKTLVLVPTRELAIQVHEVFEQFAEVLPEVIRTKAVFGGVSVNTQMMALRAQHVLVATPGRLLELIDSNALHLDSVETLVLDEADKMLNLGFKDEMNRIIELLPEKRQNLLFSATLSHDIENITQLILSNPLVIKGEDDEEKADDSDLINQLAYLVTEARKGPLLRYIIKEQNLQQVLIFASSAHRVDGVVNKLLKNKIDAAAIHGKKSMEFRREVLREFKEGELRVLVATDLLSRGIDIDELPCVINYELPRSPKDYVHRIGRTGRAESEGQAISLITPLEEHHFKIIQKKMKKEVETVDSININLHGY